VKQTVKDLLKKTRENRMDELWPEMDKRYQEGLELRQPFERQWLINLAFLSGRQYSYYNTASRQLNVLKQRKGRLRVVDNKILPRYQKQVSRLIRSNPKVSVIPASSSQDDIKSAKTGDKVLKCWWRNNQMRKKIRELAGWIYSCGNAFLDDRWNPRLGPIRINPETGEAEYLGDADVGVLSPFEVLVPSGGPGQVEMRDLPWVMKVRFKHISWFRDNYKRGKEVLPEATSTVPFGLTNLLGVTSSSAHRAEEGAVLRELYIKPTEGFPRGLYLAGAHGVVLAKDDYPFDEYHLEQFKDLEIPGVFWGMATTAAAIWLQKIHNRTLSDIAEFNRVMARGKWLIPRNAKVEVLPDDTHGQRILYNPVLGHKPEMMTVKGLPETYKSALALVAQGLMELYHQHEVTQGTNRSDLRSGEMVQLLLEQDDHGNIPTHALFEESLSVVMKRVLRRIQKGYKEERMISITGSNNEFEVFSFKGADLRNNTDVYVTPDSSIPDSKLARQARIKENYKEGLYGNPQEEETRERVLKMLDEVPEDLQDIFSEGHLDRQNARMENKAMLSQTGIRLLVNQYDNHQLHLQEHNKQRKQPEYQKLKLSNPRAFAALEAVFINHCSQHSAFLAKQREAQMREMALMEKMRKGGG